MNDVTLSDAVAGQVEPTDKYVSASNMRRRRDIHADVMQTCYTRTICDLA